MPSSTHTELHPTWWLQLFLGAFISLGALFGGAMLVVAPDGSLLGLSPTVLAGTPFSDFSLPGWALIGLLGLGHALVFLLTLLRSPRAARWSALMGGVLFGWILIQVMMIGYQMPLQPLFGVLGLIEAINGFRRQRRT